MTLRVRRIRESLAVSICTIAAIIAAGMLFIIIGTIGIGALPSLTPYFLLTPESATPGVGQGIANAIVGSIILSLMATLLATPLAFGTAIYLKRYAPENRITGFIRFMIEVLSGTPSIVIGMFGLLVLVMYLKQFTGGFSLIAGSIALAILIVPVIERTIESAIDTVGSDLEEGSYALGATKWQTLRMVTIPAAISGITTSIILGFGRAAEESSVVILTAGYTQFMPEFAIRANDNLIWGFKIYPFNDLIGTLPYAIYNAYENSNVIPMSNAYAIAFTLIVIVMLVNVSAKLIFLRGISSGTTGSSGTIAFLKKYLERKDTPSSGSVLPQNLNENLGTDKHPLAEKNGKNIGFPQIKEVISDIGSSLSSRIPQRFQNKRKQGMYDLGGEKTENREQTSPSEKGELQEDSIILSSGEEERSDNPTKQCRVPVSSRFRLLLSKLRRPSTPKTSSFPQELSSHSAEMPKKSGSQFGKVFLLTLAPFALIAGVLFGLSVLIPVSGTGLAEGIVGLIVLLIATIVAGTGCTFAALLLRRRLSRSLKKNNRLPVNRKGTTAALVTGICIVFVCAFLFSAHLILPAGSAGGQSGSAANPLSLLGLGTHDTTTQQPMNRTEQLEALIAAEGNSESGASTTPAADTTPIVVPITTVPVSPAGAAVTPSVPLKDALTLRESYQYGNADRRCIATVYNQTVLPFYFWWLIDYNRFVQETPGTGNKTLVVFLRIENAGNKSAIVPSADAVVVTYQGTTYTHQPYFNASYLSDWQIDYYSTHLDALPYQWIREIGQKKRDYGYLTGYNIFGQNLTRLDSTSEVPNPGFDINGKGFFIQPGSSNAIDGYLIYDVPDAVAADLKNAYVQVAFNSISSTRWRLGT